jgi:hypothetical protein
VQDIRVEGGALFDNDAFLAMCEQHGHNFIRLWHWEHAERAGWTEEKIVFSPLPYPRTGPGLALDGKPKFDISAWNEVYFQRLRERVVQARERGFYVSVMLFQGWSLRKTGKNAGDPFLSHPLNAANNIQGIGAPHTNEDSQTQPTLHSVLLPSVLAVQEAYVRKVIDTVNDLDNVLFEIINEGGSVEWQRHMIRLVREYERGKPRQHPVGFTHSITTPMWNEELFESEADWVSPAKEPLGSQYAGSVFLQHYEEDPPEANGRKVVVLDTDHLWGHGGNPRWVWKAFLRGHNPIFMDSWEPIPGRLSSQVAPWMVLKGGISKNVRDYPDWEPVREQMGAVARMAARLDLAKMQPASSLTSTRYCLAEPERAYLIYLPEGGKVTIDLRAGPGEYDAEWYIPSRNPTLRAPNLVRGGDYLVLEAPIAADAVLLLSRRQ